MLPVFFDSVLDLIVRTSTDLPPDVRAAMKGAIGAEQPGTRSAQALKIIALNIDQAASGEGAICQDTGMPTFEVRVEGEPWSIEPRVQDEIYRIAREALRNAFAHGKATLIETDITFAVEQLRVRVRDNGTGLDVTTLENGGRAGHWGLVGMRERATRIGASFDVRSRPGAGTEVDVCLTGSRIYTAASSRPDQSGVRNPRDQP
jgi:signal transduction histidine kinase